MSKCLGCHTGKSELFRCVKQNQKQVLNKVRGKTNKRTGKETYHAEMATSKVASSQEEEEVKASSMLSTKPTLGEPPSRWLPDFLKPARGKHHLSGFLT